MTEQEAYGQAFENGRKVGDAEGYARGKAEAACRNIPESPFDDDYEVCPSCGSGEYLYNEDGNRNSFCGQCGQAIDWTEPKEMVNCCPVCDAPSVGRYCPNCGARMDGDGDG